MANQIYTQNQQMVESNRFRKIDPDHMIFRRFLAANIANIHFAHSELERVNDRLLHFEYLVAHDRAPDDNWVESEAESLRAELRESLRNYDEACRIYERFSKGTSPAQYLYERLKENSKGALKQQLGEEDSFEDSFVLGATEKGPLHRYIDRTGFLRNIFVKASYFSKRRAQNMQDSPVETYSEMAVRLTEEVTVTMLFSILLLIPILGLSFMKNKIGKILLVFAMVLLVSIINSVVANSVQRASLGVVAAYTAVLVVFLSNNIEERLNLYSPPP